MILTEIWRVVSEANRYFASEEPWVKRKSDPARMQTILYVTAEILRIIAIMAQPFMPASMEKLLDLLNVQRASEHSPMPRSPSLVTGSSLLAPIRFFRVTSKRRKIIAKRSPVLIDSHFHLDFADSPPSVMPWSNAPAPLGLGG